MVLLVADKSHNSRKHKIPLAVSHRDFVKVCTACRALRRPCRPSAAKTGSNRHKPITIAATGGKSVPVDGTNVLRTDFTVLPATKQKKRDILLECPSCLSLTKKIQARSRCATTASRFKALTFYRFDHLELN